MGPLLSSSRFTGFLTTARWSLTFLFTPGLHLSGVQLAPLGEHKAKPRG